ncbi:quinolinate synthase [Phycisphaeraceae bacterium D3-23]
MLWQPAIPDEYTQLNDEQLDARIAARKQELGSDLVILGHHYQQDDVIAFADFTGDSFKLSQLAAEQVKKNNAKYVIFAGVHFMAETADILTDDGVAVLLPDLGAGCSMADMADYEQTVECWEQLEEVLGRGQGAKGPSDKATELGARYSTPRPLDPSAPSAYRVIPICYMNSSAAIKAFCGMHGGAVCTSSNCDAIFDWALAGGDTPLEDGEQVKILFLPDQHLGRNTGAAAGFDPVTQMCLWDPKKDLGGNDEQQILDSTFILWKGHCSVHKLFRPEHVDEARAEWPDVTVIAHPECCYELCQKADMTGSTEGIIQAIESAEPGTRWAIATEVHLVNRLVNEAKTRGVEARILSQCQCLCTTMYRIDRPHMLWLMDNLVEGKVLNQISVHPEAKKHALVALNRMLDITAKAKVNAVKTIDREATA